MTDKGLIFNSVQRFVAVFLVLERTGKISISFFADSNAACTCNVRSGHPAQTSARESTHANDFIQWEFDPHFGGTMHQFRIDRSPKRVLHRAGLRRVRRTGSQRISPSKTETVHQANQPIRASAIDFHDGLRHTGSTDEFEVGARQKEGRKTQSGAKVRGGAVERNGKRLSSYGGGRDEFGLSRVSFHSYHGRGSDLFADFQAFACGSNAPNELSDLEGAAVWVGNFGGSRSTRGNDH